MMLFFDSGSSNSTTKFQEVWVVNTYSESEPTTSMMAFELSSVYICYIDYALITKKPCIILHCIVFSKNTLSLNALISGYLSYPSPYGADLDPCGRRAECDVRYLPFRAPKLSRSVAGFQLFICRHADFASRIICWNRLFPTILGLIEWGLPYDQVKNSCRFIKHSWLQTTTIMSSHAYLNAKKHPYFEASLVTR